MRLHLLEESGDLVCDGGLRLWVEVQVVGAKQVLVRQQTLRKKMSINDV